MPVNMDPLKKRRGNQATPAPPDSPEAKTLQPLPHAFGTETHDDREKDLADAEWKNLWEATEVIDMDKI